MNFSNIDVLGGVMKTLLASGKVIDLPDYVVEKKDGEVDGTKMAGSF